MRNFFEKLGIKIALRLRDTSYRRAMLCIELISRMSNTDLMQVADACDAIRASRESRSVSKDDEIPF